MDEDRIKKNALNAMITCSVIAVISVIAFIFIVIFDRDKSDIPLFGALFGDKKNDMINYYEKLEKE